MEDKIQIIFKKNGITQCNQEVELSTERLKQKYEKVLKDCRDLLNEAIYQEYEKEDNEGLNNNKEGLNNSSKINNGEEININKEINNGEELNNNIELNNDEIVVEEDEELSELEDEQPIKKRKGKELKRSEEHTS